MSLLRSRRKKRRAPMVKQKRLPFSPKSQSGECPCCRKPGKSLAEQPCFFKARYSSVPSRGVTVIFSCLLLPPQRLSCSLSVAEPVPQEVARDNLTEVLAMREPLQDPDPSSGRGGEVMWRCPPGQQLSERYGAFPSLSYTRGGRRGGRPRVKGKRLPFSPKSQSRECPCCRKLGESLAELPCSFKARYSSTFRPVVRSNERAEDGLQGRENQSEASGQLDSKWGETLMPGEQRSFHC
ncbi:uncharacterized protein [Phaenicophaeus curvirostris]|uniref:uncharacterized protein n=1 Tax=Phaenicophaeus curvirostris TaxID=33595 RepID=UPI0037F0DB19